MRGQATSSTFRFRGLSRLATGVCAWLAILAVTMQSARSQSIGGAVLLQNDRLIEGQVVPSGDFFSIQVAEQSRVSIPKSEVVHVAADKRGIYQFKRDAVKRWEAGDHFQMTRWCMLNELHAEAAGHYREVADLHGDHPRVRQLALELQSRLLKIPEFRSYLGLAVEESKPGSKPGVSVAETQSGAAPKSLASTGSVVTASTNKDFSATTAAALHPQIAAQFSRRIQPILMNRCGQPACHGAQSNNGLRILEPYRAAYERVSSENLRSVLAHVSTNSGELSALLQYATTAHGIQPQAGISITETKLLTELTNWIQFVQNPVATAVAETSASSSGASVAGGRIAAPTPFVPYSPAAALVPVQPGASGLRPVPKDSMNGQMLGGEIEANPAYFPNGDVPLSSEIEALDRQLQQILGENRGQQKQPSPMQSQSSGGRQPAAGGMPTADRPGVHDPFDPAAFNRQSRQQGEIHP
jgi:hypothetical protein